MLDAGYSILDDAEIVTRRESYFYRASSIARSAYPVTAPQRDERSLI
jgi:hypothetical protein